MVKLPREKSTGRVFLVYDCNKCNCLIKYKLEVVYIVPRAIFPQIDHLFRADKIDAFPRGKKKKKKS